MEIFFILAEICMKSYSEFVKKWSAMIKYVKILPAGVLNNFGKAMYSLQLCSLYTAIF